MNDIINRLMREFNPWLRFYFVFVKCQRANDMRASPNKVNDTKRDYVIMKIIMISVRELIARDTALAI